MSGAYNRDAELGKTFSEAIKSIVDDHSETANSGDYYSNLSIETLIRLKKALSNINNIITLEDASQGRQQVDYTHNKLLFKTFTT